jgi:chromate transporter
MKGMIGLHPQAGADLMAETENTPAPSFNEALSAWARIGLLSFGGPAAQIALMHRVVVDEKRWLKEPQFLNALSFCMFLPGPEAMQLATYAGWRLHGVKGGLAAGLLFVIPGALIVLALASIYAAFGAAPLVQTLFLGVKAAVIVIVLEALLRISKRALKASSDWIIAGLAFVGIFFLGAPFPLIVLAAAIWGAFRATGPREAASTTTLSAKSTGLTIAIWLALWLLPLLALTWALGGEHVLSQIGWFFSKLAVVTFGGAYAVLSYMAQDAVSAYGWLTAGAMMDGLGLAETTPGPLILVTEFVGFLAGFNGAGWGVGIAGAGVALWATFTPCFLWIFAGAPYIEWLNGQPRLKGALAGITAAVVGVILNLAIWFALHVFFADVSLQNAGPLTLWLPDFATLDWTVVGITIVSGYLLLKRHWSVPPVLSVAAGLAFAASFV